MYQYMLNTGSFPRVNGVFLGILVIWSLVWKGLALWRAARRGENVWFIVLLIINSAGILDLIYYYLIAKTDKKK